MKKTTYFEPDEEMDPLEEIEELDEVLVVIEEKRPRKKSSKPPKEYVNKDEMWREIKEYYLSLGDVYDWTKQRILDKKAEFPELSRKLATMVDDIATKMGYMPNFLNYCVDDQTEALTQRGWLRHDQITENDIILSYDVYDKCLKWSKINGIFRNHDYDGLMHKWSIIGMDALVTPGHKVVTVEDKLIEVEKVRTDHHVVLMGSGEMGGLEKHNDEFVRIVGWAITEGHYMHGKRSNAVGIYQKRGFHCDEIRECLNKLQAKYKEYFRNDGTEMTGYHVTKQVANDIIKVAPNKVLSPEFILELTPNQRLLLIETMVNGDGWIRKNKLKDSHKTPWSYCQRCKDHVDAFLMLCTVSGLTTSCIFTQNPSEFSDKPYYIVNIHRNPLLFCRAENIDFHGGRPGAGGNLRNGKRPNQPTESYKGTVWCPQTEYGTWVCRRGRTIYVTGNSYLDEMRGDAKSKMLKAIRDCSFKCYSTHEILEQTESEGITYIYYKDKKNKIQKKSKESSDVFWEEDGKKWMTMQNNIFGYMSRVCLHAYLNRIKKEKLIAETKQKYQEEVWNKMLSTELWANVRRPKYTDIDENESVFENE